MDTTAIHSDGLLAESLSAFLRSLEGENGSEATRQAYHTDLLQFFIWLKESDWKSGDFGPEDITKGDVIEFLALCARRGLSGLSRARKLAAIREYYRLSSDRRV